MSAHLTKDLLLSSMLETDSAESKKVTQLLDISSFQTESRLAFVTKQNAESESQKTDDENFPGKATSSPSLNSGDVDATTLSAVLAQNSNTKAYVPSSPNRSPSTLKTLSFREQPLPQPLAPSSTASSLTQQLQMHRRSQGSGPPPGLRGVMVTGVYNADDKPDTTSRDPITIHGVGAISVASPDPDALNCTIYIPCLPKQQARTPFFVQLAAPLDCTARQLMQLARRQFHADLTRLCLTAAQFVDPLLAAHVNTRKLARLQRERAGAQLTNSLSSHSFSVSRAEPEPVPQPLTTSTSALLGTGAPGVYSAQYLNAQGSGRRSSATQAAAPERYPLGVEIPREEDSGSYNSHTSTSGMSTGPSTSVHGSESRGPDSRGAARKSAPEEPTRLAPVSTTAAGSTKRRGRGTPSRRPCALILPPNSPYALQQQQQPGQGQGVGAASVAVAAGPRHTSHHDVGEHADAVEGGVDAVDVHVTADRTPNTTPRYGAGRRGRETPSRNSYSRSKGDHEELSDEEDGVGRDKSIDGKDDKDEDARTVLEIGFTQEDIFEDEVTDMQLVVWSEELREVDTNVPPLLPFASIRASGFDTFALQRQATQASRYSSRGRSRYGFTADEEDDDNNDDESTDGYTVQRSRTSSHVPPRPMPHLLGRAPAPLEPTPAPVLPVAPRQKPNFFARLCACIRGDTTREEPLPDSVVPSTPRDSNPMFGRYGAGSNGRVTFVNAIEMQRQRAAADDDDDDDIDLEDLGLPIAKDANL